MGSQITLTRHPSGQFLLSTVIGNLDAELPCRASVSGDSDAHLPDGFVLRAAFPKGTTVQAAYLDFCKLMQHSMDPL